MSFERENRPMEGIIFALCLEVGVGLGIILLIELVKSIKEILL